MKDYSLTLKVRNNYLLMAMRQRGYSNAAQLWRASGVSQASIGKLLNLRDPALNKRGEWKGGVLALAKFFGCAPEALVPPQHQEWALPSNTAEIEASPEDLMAFAHLSHASAPLLPDAEISRTEVLALIDTELDLLAPRTQHIIRQHFGLDPLHSEPRTATDIAAEYGISKSRCCQIIDRGLRKMRLNSKQRRTSTTLLEFIGDEGDRAAHQ